jgi:uncharacterized protein (DUF362 family)
MLPLQEFARYHNENLMKAVCLAEKNYSSLNELVECGINSSGNISIEKNSLVVIKPNLTTAKSSEKSGFTTPVDIVEATINLINKKTNSECEIAIVESDSDGRIEDTFVALGYDRLSAKYRNVKLVDLGRQPHYKVVMPHWCKTRMIDVPEILLNMNCFLNIANLKRHIQERVTMNWKNIYGLPANHLVRMRYHQFLNQILFELNYLFWPDIAIIDARVGLAGAGPMTGYPMDFGYVLFSKSPLTNDLAALKIIKEKWKKVPTLRYAVRLMKTDPEKVIVGGDSFAARPLPFVKELVFYSVRLGLSLRKWATCFENLSLMCWLVGVAMRMGNPAKFAGGGIQSLGTSLKVAWRMLRTIDLSEKVYE